MKFREHRGHLYDSMQTLVEVADRKALVEHINKLYQGYPPVTEETLRIEPYGRDDRINWDTYIVTLPGYGVIGMTDSKE